jgi:phenylacetate-CoA ligase
MAIRLGFRAVHANTAVGQRYRALERSQWASPESVLEEQWRRLRDLVRHAHERVPFYRARLEAAGLEPARLQGPEDYRRLPILTRQELRAHKDELVALGVRRSRLVEVGSSGSTGEPVTLYHDAPHLAGIKAAKLRNFRWAGWEPGDAWARLWGTSPTSSRIAAHDFDAPVHRRLAGWLVERLTRVRWLSCFDLSDERMARYARELVAFRPDVIEAYVNPLHLFARYLRAHDLAGAIRPRGVIVSAETLFEHQRAEIEAAFGCKVLNRYGCSEVGDVAHECPLGGLHLNAETVYAEFIRDGRPAAPGEDAEIVLTPLDLRAMPLLRYRIGDVGSPAAGACPCGRGLPLMARVQGRVQDIITTRSGRYLTGLFFGELLADVDARQYRVVQESLDTLDLYLVPGPGMTDRELAWVERKIAEKTGGEATLRLHLVSEIPPTPSGKHRLTVSHVELNLAGC